MPLIGIVIHLLESVIEQCCGNRVDLQDVLILQLLADGVRPHGRSIGLGLLRRAVLATTNVSLVPFIHTTRQACQRASLSRRPPI